MNLVMLELDASELLLLGDKSIGGGSEVRNGRGRSGSGGHIEFSSEVG